MVDFTASNGAEVRKLSGGSLNLDHPEWNQYRLYPGHVEALREFFLAERDEELGRWRDPEYPHIFVRPSSGGNPDWVGVVKDNAEGLAYGQFRRGDYPSLDPMSIVAHKYFAAHPEPKPWHDAKPGEVWVVDFEAGVTEAVVVPPSGWVKGLAVVTARRIWPENKES